MKKLICAVIISLLSFNSLAQVEPKNTKTSLGVNFDYGYILKHSENLRAFDDAFPIGIGLEWGKMLLSKSAWEFCNCIPKVGAEIAFWRWDNPEILGNGLLAMGFVEPYFRTHKRLNLKFRAGLGGAYLSNPYDVENNPDNLSYSTDLSFAIMVGMGLNYRLTEQLDVGMLIKYNHTSNGGVKSPNKGLNFPSLNLSLNKSLEAVEYPDFQKIENRQPPETKSRISLAYFSSWNDIDLEQQETFYVFGVSGQYSRWIGKRSALSLGTELILDYARRENIRLNGLDNNFIQAAGLLGHEFWLGKVTFSQQFGIYYYKDFNVRNDIYQRYGITYNFTKHLFAGVNLKAHGHVADFFDLRIGYTF
ncbi:acyloxyacyl hydrolase [Psychroflexus tropicus]|uniref:acyloxyacyl hydrolase n=1 Tax=Psychroflexus tropicus TaxID=197345 RepID=UPI00036411A1|nr:acyloxyacyl hydrolase [Psychroflexus tropicus]